MANFKLFKDAVAKQFARDGDAIPSSRYLHKTKE